MIDTSEATDSCQFSSDPFWAAQQQVVLFDHSDWGQLCLTSTGSEGLEYLHNQTTQTLKTLAVGEGRLTCVITPTAHVIELVTVYQTELGSWLITSPAGRHLTGQSLGRFLGFLPECQLQDHTDSRSLLRLVGPNSHALLQPWWDQGDLSQLPPFHHLSLRIEDIPVDLIADSSLGLPGYSLGFAREYRESIVSTLVNRGALPGSAQVWQQLRIVQGRPIADHELKSPYNPLESGLWSTVSLTKGCYVGQEVLAKQVTYQRIRQRLWGIRWEEAVPVQSVIHPTPKDTPKDRMSSEDKIGSEDSDKMGIVTSVIETPIGIRSLGYIRTKANLEVDQKVYVGSVAGQVYLPPFLTYPY
jgi:folate-binding protein YgfZ